MGDLPSTNIQEELEAAVKDVAALIESEKAEAAEALRSFGRSRMARMVQSLPCEDSKSICEAATRDLPSCVVALGLASASWAMYLTQGKRFIEAARECDVAMVMLGMPTALPIRRVVELLESYDLILCDARYNRGAALGSTTIEDQPQHAKNLLGECPEHDAKQFSLEQFSAFFQADRPVVIRNCASNWPAVDKWKSPQYLSTKYGNRTVPVEWTVSRSGQMTEKFCPLRFVLKQMLREPNEDQDTVYLAQHPLFDYIPGLEDDIEHPRYMQVVGKRKADLTNIWMGTAGSGSKLHFDSADNLLVQVVGEKQVMLISADQSNLLHAESLVNCSPIDVENPDLEKYPLFSRVRGTVVRLGPGDALYIPAMHWHWVKAFTSSVSVNFWF